MRILKAKPEVVAIIDDSPEDRELFARELKAYDVHTYFNIETFRKESRQAMPDVLLIDYNLGNDITALDVLREFKGIIPLMIVISGEFTRQKKFNCLLAGAVELISKDRADTVDAVIKRLWRCRDTAKEIRRNTAVSYKTM